MALFSRRKNDRSEPMSESARTPDAEVTPDSGQAPDSGRAPENEGVPALPQDAGDGTGSASETDAAVSDVPVETVPQVNISMTSFGGLGAASAPATPQMLRPENAEDVVLPLAPADPPSNLETIAGLRDNGVLRDALAALSEKPTGAELLGVARQLLQAHVYLRVRGDARAQIAAGDTLQLGVIKDGERQFMLAYSSGRSLRDAFQKDNDTDTSAFAQPTQAVIKNVLDGGLDGLIIDNDSAPARAVIPKDVLARAMEQAETNFSLKTLLSEPRSAETKAKVVEALRTARLWVAVGVASENEGAKQYGIAEAHTRDGRRLLQLFSHPLEVVALQRTEQPMPFGFDKLQTALTEHSALAGVVIDPAGPSIRLSREDLAPLLTA